MVKLQTYINKIVDMAIFVGRGYKLILIACPFTINNVLVLVVPFLVNSIKRNLPYFSNVLKQTTHFCIQIMHFDISEFLRLYALKQCILTSEFLTD